MNAAPLLVSFDSIEKYIEALPEKQKTEYSDIISKLHSEGLPPVVSEYCLAVLFGYSMDFIFALSKHPHKFYRTFDIRNGSKTRKINAPRVALKVIQKWLGFHLANASLFPPHVFGFIKGKSFVDAAKAHIDADWVYSVDIENFFPSITHERVATSLITKGYSEHGASLIADLCCLNGALAQGSPTSPVLSNLVMQEADSKLIEIADRYNLNVTRYADDITFSGKGAKNPEFEQELNTLFHEQGLVLNDQKRFYAEKSKGQRLKVHGLLVKEDTVKLTKGYRNKIRAFKHLLNNGKVLEDDIARLTGHVKFSEFVNDAGKD
ncbi:reverse transcriptase family protein [Alishewanella sp. SMS8]|uniref:reverse transcriptase family protein n=1 Tax=Alishewanella sp. SMS8 TaxID=2994676 RepID=UPI002742686A|nr:reverse transcriptase family protein [Alishewanella sp. SMS8]MDP5459571.1 reverse transcriptase family protein [Alishewanella sp. SMS8]